MGHENLAIQIRTFFRELFGSRLVAEMEIEALRTREHYESRLRDRDEIIADLRLQLSQARTKIDTYELTLIPLVSPAGDFLRPRPAPVLEPLTEPSGWQAIQAAWEKQQIEEALQEKKDGIRGEQVPSAEA